MSHTLVIIGIPILIAVLLCLVAVLCMPRYLDDMDVERL